MVRALPKTLLTACALVLLVPPALADDAPAAEVKVGLGIEKMDIKEPAETFTVDAGTKIYAWTRVTGCEGSSVSVRFEKDGKAVFTKDLEVPNSPHRTNAYRTFREGDAGTWTVKVVSKDGKDLGDATFKVEVK